MNESTAAEGLEKQYQEEMTEEALAATLQDDADGEAHNASADELWSYEVPRPWLSIEEAASMLGRSVRGMERSIIGRWGNKLPEGWQGRRVRIDGKDQWRIVPPPGFRVKHSKKMDPATRAALAQMEHERKSQESFRTDMEDGYLKDEVGHGSSNSSSAAEKLEQTYRQSYRDFSPSTSAASAGTDGEWLKEQSDYDYTNEDKEVPSKSAEGQSGFSLEKLFQSASQMAQKELASLGLNVKNQLIADSQNYASNLDVEHTIVIDRSDEVEKLLRELANVQKELSEERRQHMEDMRLMSQMQNNLRLLEVHATQTSELKEDLKIAQKLLTEHKKEYQAYLALPWWKKIFKSQP